MTLDKVNEFQFAFRTHQAVMVNFEIARFSPKLYLEFDRFDSELDGHFHRLHRL